MKRRLKGTPRDELEARRNWQILKELLEDNTAGGWVGVGDDGTMETFDTSDLDHGELGGLTDPEDHPWALPVDGSRSLTGDWDAGGHKITAQTLESDVGEGTAPLAVASTTLVDNLNADLLDGNDAEVFLLADGSRGLGSDWDAGDHKITAQQLESDVEAGTAPLLVASNTLVANLNADLLDGKQESAFLLADGSRGLSADWDAGGHKITAQTLESDVGEGTAPLAVASTTLVDNLNADLLDGNDAEVFLLADGSRGLGSDWDAGDHKITAQQLESDVEAGTAPLLVASNTLVANLNADLLDGKQESAFLLADGSRGLSADWDAGGHKITARQLAADVADGTAPFVVGSTTLVENLNADLLDGHEAADLLGGGAAPPVVNGNGNVLTTEDGHILTRE
ncbi:MAG: hypothetical protein ACOC7S_00855 [Planctomycetota bacterium]